MEISGELGDNRKSYQPLTDIISVAPKNKTETVGFLNYQEFLVALQNMLASGGTGCTYLEIFIDNYSSIISWYDYQRANQIIDQVVQQFSAALKPGDLICRIHLDRIGILLKSYNAKDVEKVVKKLHDAIEKFETAEFRKPMHIVASMGSVELPEAEGTLDEILHKAYMARCAADGTSSIYYSRYEDMETGLKITRDEARIMHDVQQIIDDNRLKAAFQPIIGAQDGDVAYYECLLRILNPGGEASSAGGLIPVAEKMNFIKVIDRIMLQKVVDVLKANPALKLTFNVSNATTDDAEWLKLCSKLLKNPDIASRILVEITETAAHRDLRETAYFVASLQGLGCQVALDDFGAGYTSFRQLKSLSVDMVKIDGAYVRDLVTSRENQIFLRTLVDFTGNYGLKTIAEFVETGEVAKMLIEMKIDYLQGYYFGAPEMGEPWKKKEPNLFTKGSK